MPLPLGAEVLWPGAEADGVADAMIEAENSTLGVEPDFYARSHCFMAQ
jgi:hypothetical protein